MKTPKVRALALVSACGLLATAALSGCAGSASSDSGSDGGPVRVKFWHTMTGPDGPAVKKIIDSFNASQKDVVIEPNPMPADVMTQKLLTSLTTKDGPDLINMAKGDIPAYASKGVLANTDEFYASDKYMDTSVLNPVAVEATKYDGKTYGAPFVLWTQMLYYNKDLFKKAGLDPEKPPTTWDEWVEDARKLTIDENKDGKPEQYGIALADHASTPMFQPLLWNAGGAIVSDDGTTAMLDDPKTIAGVEFWTDVIRNDHISPIGITGGDADKLFLTGKAAMETVGPWMTTGVAEAGIDFGLAKIPAGPGGDDTLADVGTLSISAKADERTKDACYQFMAYWNAVDSQITWANGSGFPPNRSDVPMDKIESPYPAQFGAKDIMDSIRILLPGLNSAGTIDSDIFTPALQQVLNGQGSVDKVFTEADKKAQAELDSRH